MLNIFSHANALSHVFFCECLFKSSAHFSMRLFLLVIESKREREGEKRAGSLTL